MNPVSSPICGESIARLPAGAPTSSEVTCRAWDRPQVVLSGSEAFQVIATGSPVCGLRPAGWMVSIATVGEAAPQSLTVIVVSTQPERPVPSVTVARTV